MSSNNSNKGSSSSSSSNGGNQGWSSIPDSQITGSSGGMHGFMHSYGMKATPDGYQAARETIDAFKQADYQQQQSRGNHK